MDLRDLRPFYEQVTPERLTEYLRGHEWVWDDWSRGYYRNGLFVACGGIMTPYLAELAVERIAELEDRNFTAVLFDLLPATSRRAFVLHVFPQLTEVLPEELG